MGKDPRTARIEEHLDRETAKVQDRPHEHAVMVRQRERFLRETLGRCDAWAHPSLPDQGVEAACDVNACSFQIWHAPAGSRGIAALNNFAIYVCDRNYGLGQDIASQAYIGTLERLAASVDRHANGDTDADGRKPDARANADNVTGYVRKAVKWARNNLHRRSKHDVEFDEAWMEDALNHATDDLDFKPTGRIESVALRFASIWLALDLKKDPDRLWRMLMHALGLQALGFDPRGSQRNEPALMERKLRVRIRVCLGLGRWLRNWAELQGSDFWASGDDLVPRSLDDDVPRDAVGGVLERIRPALTRAIDALDDATDEERKALHSVLIKASHVNNQLPSFAGDDALARFERMSTLAEEVGSRAVEFLAPDRRKDERPPDRRGGPPCGHTANRHRLRGIAQGDVPDVAAMTDAHQQMADCDDCRLWWQGTCEEIEHAPRLAGQLPAWAPAEERAPRLSRGWAWIPIAAAAAAIAILAITGPWNDRTEGSSRLPVDIDSTPGEGESMRIPVWAADVPLEVRAFEPDGPPEGAVVADGATLPAGARLRFTLGAKRPGLVHALHQHPDGHWTMDLPEDQASWPRWDGGRSMVEDATGAPFDVTLADEPGIHRFFVAVTPTGIEIRGMDLAEMARDAPALTPQDLDEARELVMGLVGQRDIQLGKITVLVGGAEDD